jgi:hypothetical protein
MKNRIFQLGMLALVIAFSSCASIRPMDLDTILQYNLYENLELFKSYQYFVSKDIVLSRSTAETETGIRSGQAFSSTNVAHDVKQILSSTPGVALEVDFNVETGKLRLGIAFEVENDNLLWFYYNVMGDGYFYLDYTDYDNNVIEYAGNKYGVTYEQASGLFAGLKRLTTIKKTKDAQYDELEPLLLYEENTKVKEKEQRQTLQGRRIN